MELLYKIDGYVSSDNTNAVIKRVRRMQNMNIPVTADPVNEDGFIMPAIKFSFYKRADEDFVDLFLNELQSKMTLEGGEFYIANPYTGKTGVYRPRRCHLRQSLLLKRGRRKI